MGISRGAILALSTSRKDIDDDADGATVGVAEETRLNERKIALRYDRFTTGEYF
jgi:hypothetical protein